MCRIRSRKMGGLAVLPGCCADHAFLPADRTGCAISPHIDAPGHTIEQIDLREAPSRGPGLTRVPRSCPWLHKTYARRWPDGPPGTPTVPPPLDPAPSHPVLPIPGRLSRCILRPMRPFRSDDMLNRNSCHAERTAGTTTAGLPSAPGPNSRPMAQYRGPAAKE